MFKFKAVYLAQFSMDFNNVDLKIQVREWFIQNEKHYENLTEEFCSIVDQMLILSGGTQYFHNVSQYCFQLGSLASCCGLCAALKTTFLCVQS